MIDKKQNIRDSSNKSIEKLKRVDSAKEITRAILSIAGVAGLTVLGGGGGTPENAQGAWAELGKYSNARIKQCLKRLKLQEYIKYDEKDLTKPIFVTKKGLQKKSIITLKDRLGVSRMKKWDRLWRLVTYDVNENYKKTRDNFRHQLKSMGFYQLQKNIFVIPFPIEDELEEVIKVYGLRSRALVLQVANLGKNEDRVRKYFFDAHKKSQKVIKDNKKNTNLSAH